MHESRVKWSLRISIDSCLNHVSWHDLLQLAVCRDGYMWCSSLTALVIHAIRFPFPLLLCMSPVPTPKTPSTRLDIAVVTTVASMSDDIISAASSASTPVSERDVEWQRFYDEYLSVPAPDLPARHLSAVRGMPLLGVSNHRPWVSRCVFDYTHRCSAEV